MKYSEVFVKTQFELIERKRVKAKEWDKELKFLIDKGVLDSKIVKAYKALATVSSEERWENWEDYYPSWEGVVEVANDPEIIYRLKKAYWALEQAIEKAKVWGELYHLQELIKENLLAKTIAGYITLHDYRMVEEVSLKLPRLRKTFIGDVLTNLHREKTPLPPVKEAKRIYNTKLRAEVAETEKINYYLSIKYEDGVASHTNKRREIDQSLTMLEAVMIL